MPIVPKYQPTTGASVTGLPAPRQGGQVINPSTAASFDMAVAPGRAMQGMAQSIGGASEQLLKLQEQRNIRNDNITALNLFTEYDEAVRQMNTEALSRQGSEAFGLYENHSKALEEITRKTLEKAGNDRVRMMFNEHAYHTQNASLNQIASHQAREEKVARDTGIGNLIQTHITMINDTPDEKQLGASIQTISDTIDMHYPAEEATKIKNKARQKLKEQFIFSKATTDPSYALEYLKAWKETGEIGGKEYMTVKAAFENIVKKQEADKLYLHIDQGGSLDDYKFTPNIGLDTDAKADVLREGKRYESIFRGERDRREKELQEKTEGDLLRREAAGEFISLDELDALNTPGENGIQALSNTSYKHFTKSRGDGQTDWETYLSLREKFAEGTLTSADIMANKDKLSSAHLKQFIDDANKQDNDLRKIKTKEWGKYIGGILSERFGKNPSEENLEQKAKVLDEFYSLAKDMEPAEIEEFAKGLVAKEHSNAMAAMWNWLLTYRQPSEEIMGMISQKRGTSGLQVAQDAESGASPGAIEPVDTPEDERRRLPGESAMTYLQRMGLE